MHSPDDPLLTLERYSMSEAGRILQVSSQSIGNWFRGYRRGEKLYEPLFQSPGVTAAARDRISFLELAEAKVVAACRAQGLGMIRIRRAREFAREWLGAEYPLATQGFKTDGSRILYAFEDRQEARPSGPMFVDVGNSAGQTTLPGYITDALTLFEFASESQVWPARFYPRGEGVPIQIDPHIRGGQVSIAGRGLPIESIKRRYRGGDSARHIAEDFELDPAEVDAVIEY